jgi:hypothetical protein
MFHKTYSRHKTAVDPFSPRSGVDSVLMPSFAAVVAHGRERHILRPACANLDQLAIYSTT